MCHGAVSATVFLLSIQKTRKGAVNFSVFWFMASYCWRLLTFCIYFFISLSKVSSVCECNSATYCKKRTKLLEVNSQFLLHSEKEI